MSDIKLIKFGYDFSYYMFLFSTVTKELLVIIG